MGRGHRPGEVGIHGSVCLLLRMSDGPLGVHDYGPTTAYPGGILLAASWDTALTCRVGESMGSTRRPEIVALRVRTDEVEHYFPMLRAIVRTLFNRRAANLLVPFIDGLEENPPTCGSAHAGNLRSGPRRG
jgi:hypothetical protein